MVFGLPAPDTCQTPPVIARLPDDSCGLRDASAGECWVQGTASRGYEVPPAARAKVSSDQRADTREATWGHQALCLCSWLVSCSTNGDPGYQTRGLGEGRFPRFGGGGLISEGLELIR